MTNNPRRFGRILASLAAVGILTASVTAYAQADTNDKSASTLVKTDKGAVRGSAEDGYRSFKGIPYAAPPVDELRWKSPQPAASWDKTRKADESGPACAQFKGNEVGIPNEDEDCLYLDVYAPDKPTSKKLPVMMWIHGGSHLYGAGSMYNAGAMAEKGDAIVVTINYRLGAFGSLAHPALDESDGTTSSGNYGLEDQQAALRWVQNNAKAFGGDAGNVTAMGESGGGYDVCAQLTSESAAGLIDRAVLQSAPCAQPWATPRDKGQDQAAKLAEQLDCDTAADVAECLRGTTVAKVLDKSKDVFAEGAPPVLGGPVLKVETGEALASGDFNKVPVIQGVNHDEWQLMIGGMEVSAGEPLTAEGYPAALGQWFGDNAKAVEVEYPLSDYDNPSKALSAALSDQQFAAPAQQTTDLLAAHVPTYTYDFAERNTPWFTIYEPPTWPSDAYHMVDTAFLFDVDYIAPLNKTQKRISNDMIGYWTAFAHDGNPNRSGAPQWKQFAKKDYTQRLASGKHGIGRTDFAAEHHLDFWKSLNG